jgi:hypothetical protein
VTDAFDLSQALAA